MQNLYRYPINEPCNWAINQAIKSKFLKSIDSFLIPNSKRLSLFISNLELLLGLSKKSENQTEFCHTIFFKLLKNLSCQCVTCFGVMLSIGSSFLFI